MPTFGFFCSSGFFEFYFVDPPVINLIVRESLLYCLLVVDTSVEEKEIVLYHHVCAAAINSLFITVTSTIIEYT